MIPEKLIVILHNLSHWILFYIYTGLIDTMIFIKWQLKPRHKTWCFWPFGIYAIWTWIIIDRVVSLISLPMKGGTNTYFPRKRDHVVFAQRVNIDILNQNHIRLCLFIKNAFTDNVWNTLTVSTREELHCLCSSERSSFNTFTIRIFTQTLWMLHKTFKNSI